ncbi:hypothetical protein EYE40_02985 [Glaciihabitans arcticus]|uniref:Uncharacterized protein n=1 Tax=Glaciihabitans arcticus TaxID=2668039 RepID=A0A4Q9GNY9_9MICO|nr:hypothetical protein [Glaciihabitans arcticus]TBN56446.1 hypothetical protein EYE40_02985 [Glaciihabitans arcticus]
MPEITLLFIITLLAGGLSLYDGIVRLRGRGNSSILAIAELVLGALLLLSLFVAALNFALVPILLLITLLIIIFLPGKGRSARTITIIAAVLTAVLVLTSLGWLNIPGF